MFRKWSNLTNSYFSNWVVCLTTTDLVEKSLKPSIGQNALGLSKFKMPPIILGVSSSVPNFKGREVETTNSWKTSGPPYLTLTSPSYMGVSENSGTPKWMVYNENPIKNRGTPKIHHTHEFVHLVPGPPKVIKGGNSSTSSDCSASFKLLVGCRRVESRTTTLQDRVPNRDRKLLPMCLQCDFFCRFKCFKLNTTDWEILATNVC